MNAPLKKLKLERDRKAEKRCRHLSIAEELGGEIQTLDEEICRLENEEIIAAIRSEGLTYEQVFALLQELKEKGPAVVIKGSAVLTEEAAKEGLYEESKEN